MIASRWSAWFPYGLVRTAHLAIAAHRKDTGGGATGACPGKGRREQAAEAVLSPWLLSRRWRVRDQGWRERRGASAEPVQHGASPGRPLRRALFSGGLHTIPVKYTCF